MNRDLHMLAQERAAAAESLPARLQRALLPVALRGEAVAKGYATDRPRARSGILRRSIKGLVATNGDEVTLTLGAGGEGSPAERYASLQEYGGTVRATRSKFLAIPIGAALTGAGVPRYRSPRDVPGLFFLPRGSGGLLLRGTKRGPPEALFILRRSVTVPAARYIGRTWDDLVPAARTVAGDTLAEALGGSDAAR